jgi:hypothetical protein
MHPDLAGEMARQRHEAALREAELRRSRCAAGHPAPVPGLRRRIKSAVGNRMVATGWRLLEAGLARSR